MVLKISLVVAYILIDTNTMLHKGFNRNCRDLWFHSNTKTGQSRLLLLLLKAATLVAILLSDMVKTPVILLLCITVAQVFLKRVERLLRAWPVITGIVNSPSGNNGSDGSSSGREQ